MHKSTYTECRPVGDVTDGNTFLSFTFGCKLLQSLLGTEQSGITGSVNINIMLVNNQTVCLVLRLSTFHSVHLRKAYFPVSRDPLVSHAHLLGHWQQWRNIGAYGYAQDKQQHH